MCQLKICHLPCSTVNVALQVTLAYIVSCDRFLWYIELLEKKHVSESSAMVPSYMPWFMGFATIFFLR